MKPIEDSKRDASIALQSQQLDEVTRMTNTTVAAARLRLTCFQTGVMITAVLLVAVIEAQ